MDPITGGALIMGGAALAEGVATSAFNAHQSAKQMRFQERMSNTAHQREIIDLKAAGLNPILSAKLGGASSPPGASAQAHSPDVAGKIGQGLQMKAQLRLMEANTNQANSAAGLSQAQTKDVNATQTDRIQLLINDATRSLAQGQLTTEQQKEVQQQIQNLKVQQRILQNQEKSSAFDLSKKKVISNAWDVPGNAIDAIKSDFKGKKSKIKEWFRKNMPTRGGSTGRW